jgi:hypothetical protein
MLMGSVLLAVQGSAGSGFQPAGGRSAAMAHASAALFDPWGIINNQAGIVSCTSLTIGIHGENRFLMKELGYQAGFVLVPLKHMGVGGLSFTRFGYSAFSSNRAGLTLARSFGENFHCGLQLVCEFSQFRGKGYRQKRVSFEAGMIARISRDLCLALHITDPLTFVAGEEKRFTYREGLLQMATSLEISDRIILVLQAEKEIISEPRFMAGFEYKLSHLVCFRSGVMSYPVQLTFGSGIQWHRLFIDVAASMHQQLGWFPQVSLHYISK